MHNPNFKLFLLHFDFYQFFKTMFSKPQLTSIAGIIPVFSKITETHVQCLSCARHCSEQFILTHLILTTTLHGRFNYGPILQDGKL